MFFSEDMISEIVEKNDIVDVISEYVSLKKSGSNYMCLCPFHSEKSPSFSVSRSKQIFNCFGCGVGGNVITFVQKIERLTFVEALKLLAERAGIEVRDSKNEKELERHNLKSKLLKINLEAARFFYKKLHNSKLPLQYLKGRGLSEEIIKNFGLGYSLDSWDSLQKYLLSRGFNIEDIYKAGLVLPRKQSGGFYDRFRNRVMFPIIDLKGSIVGFGGRVMDNSKPKYLNSPDTPVFNKGYNMYGLNQVKRLAEIENIIIVEGYMDVIALHQYGICNAVASLGTAFTEYQAKLLKRFSNEIIIAYDADTAGQNATMRGLAILEKEGCSVKVLSIPSGKDPDEHIRNNGVNSFKELVKASLPLIQYKIESARKSLDMSKFENRIAFTKQFAQILRIVESEVEIDAYIKKYSKELQIGEEAIYSELNRLKGRNKNGNIKHNILSDKKSDAKPQKAEYTAEIYLLNICIDSAEEAKNILSVVKPHDFTVSIHRDIAEILEVSVKNDKLPTAGELINSFEEQYKAEVSEIFSIALPDMAIPDLIKSCVDTIKKSKISRRIQELTNRMNEFYQKGEIQNANAVFNEIKELQKTIK
ncbi:MAG: DNA primase [Bacillota bacterium]